MCGLVGMMGNFFNHHERMFKHLLIFDTLRGAHSTGVAVIDRNKDIKLFKSPVPGWDFVEDPKFDRLLSYTDKIWIGHNRFATVGKVNKNNAHPFVVEDADGSPVLVGAHNGTLSNRGDAIEKAYDYGTDSEGLFNSIAALGVEEAISRATGAWALSFFSKDDDKLFFLRNDERPLFFCFLKNRTTKKEDTVAWASEEWMLRVAAERSEIDIGKMYYFSPNILYSFKLPKDIGKPLSYRDEGEVKGKAAAPFQSQRTAKGGTGFSDTWKTKEGRAARYNFSLKRTEIEAQEGVWKLAKWDGNISQYVLEEEKSTPPSSTTTSSTSDKSTSSPGETEDKKNVSVIFKGYEGERLAPSELNKILDKGCVWCGTKIERRRGSVFPVKAVTFIGREEAVCLDCVADTHEKPATYRTLSTKTAGFLKEGRVCVINGKTLSRDGLEFTVKEKEVVEPCLERKVSK